MALVRMLIATLIGLSSGLADQPFTVGERLDYTARFNVLPVGNASLLVEAQEMIGGVNTYQFKYQARTGEVADRLFKIRDKITIWADDQNFHTYRINKNIHEGKHRYKNITRFNYTDSLAISNQDTIPVTDFVRDPYSLFYYIRTLPIKVGETLSFSTFDNKKLTDFKVIVTGVENISVPAGDFSCLVVKPFREQRTLFKNQGDMEVWFSNDELRLPVQIHLKLKYGTMVLKLKQVSNLN